MQSCGLRSKTARQKIVCILKQMLQKTYFEVHDYHPIIGVLVILMSLFAKQNI